MSIAPLGDVERVPGIDLPSNNESSLKTNFQGRVWRVLNSLARICMSPFHYLIGKIQALVQYFTQSGKVRPEQSDSARISEASSLLRPLSGASNDDSERLLIEPDSSDEWDTGSEVDDQMDFEGESLSETDTDTEPDEGISLGFPLVSPAAAIEAPRVESIRTPIIQGVPGNGNCFFLSFALGIIKSCYEDGSVREKLQWNVDKNDRRFNLSMKDSPESKDS